MQTTLQPECKDSNSDSLRLFGYYPVHLDNFSCPLPKIHCEPAHIFVCLSRNTIIFLLIHIFIIIKFFRLPFT